MSAGTAVTIFNDNLKAFVMDLAEAFPDEPSIAMFLDTFDAVISITPRGPMESFVDSLAPHSALVAARDESLFAKLKFPGGIDFDKLWKSGISDNTKQAIWNHISLLFGIGNMLRNLPPNALAAIEALAGHMQEQVQQTGQLDLPSLLGGLMSGLASAGLGGGSGGNGSGGGSGADLVGTLNAMLSGLNLGGGVGGEQQGEGSSGAELMNAMNVMLPGWQQAMMGLGGDDEDDEQPMAPTNVRRQDRYKK